MTLVRKSERGWILPFPAAPGDPEGHRHAETGHDVEDLAGDFGFGLLCRQSPGVEAAPDHLFVPKHRHFPERLAALINGALPSQPTTLSDQLDVPFALSGFGVRRALR
jgi:hypothetical protein